MKYSIITCNFPLYCISLFLSLISSLNMYLSVISLKYCTIFSSGVHKRAMEVLYKCVIDLSMWFLYSASNIIRLYTLIYFHNSVHLTFNVALKWCAKQESLKVYSVKCPHGEVWGVYGGGGGFSFCALCSVVTVIGPRLFPLHTACASSIIQRW